MGRRWRYIVLICLLAIFLLGFSAVFLGGGVEDVNDVTDGLVGYWKLDEGTGTTATDSSGGGNNGTISGATWTGSGKFGNGLDFEVGNSPEVFINHNFDSADVTITAWVNRRTMASDGFIVNKFSSASDGWGMRAHQTEYIVNIYDDIDNADTQRYGTNTGSGFHHIAIVMEGLENKLYIDGSPIGSGASSSGAFNSFTGTFWFGQRGNDILYFDGILNEVRIYNRALSSEEIGIIYAFVP